MLGVFTGDFELRTEYIFSSEPDIAPGIINSSCWKGFIAHFILTGSGKLILEKYEDLTGAPQPINEEVFGDFWVALGVSHDWSACVHIPFENGRITNQAKWHGDVASLDSSLDQEDQDRAVALSYLDDMKEFFVRYPPVARACSRN